MKVWAGLLMAVVAGWANAETITLAGSSTIMPLMEQMMPTLQAHGIDARIQGGGSGAGIKSTKMGMAQIGMVSRALTEDESKDFDHLVIARDWVVLIANKQRSLSDITTQQVVDIYSGKVSTWDDDEPIHAVGKEAGRATKEVFDAHFGLLGKTRKDLIIIGANGQAITSVANDKNALAYVSYADAEEAALNGESISILTLDGERGTPENVAAGKYPLARELNLVFLRKHGELKERMRLVLSDEAARKVFLDHHVMPVL